MYLDVESNINHVSIHQANITYYASTIYDSQGLLILIHNSKAPIDLYNGLSSPFSSKIDDKLNMTGVLIDHWAYL